MEYQIKCPACGAPLTVSDDAAGTTCDFCKNHFSVDLSGTELQLQSAPSEAQNQPEPAETAGLMDIQSGMPGQMVQPPVDLLDMMPGPNPEPQPFTVPPVTGAVQRLFGGRLWLAIALAVSAVFCGSCACMTLLFTRLFQQ